jgi:uncharacterized Ntn-hydrolase superfamily protein
MGVAVQTAMFAVGAGVPWCRPGVGVVASQAMGEPAYGPRCLDLLAAGATPDEALSAAIALDALSEMRQVAVLGVEGRPEVATGTLCIDHAGHFVDDDFTVQANMASTPAVWTAMAETFASSHGTLAWRLHTALVAGAAAGGDARGVCSAALVVVRADPPPQPGAGVVVDLRIDRSNDPIGDLGQLLDASDAYAEFSVGVDQLMAGDANALDTLDRAIAHLPGEENFRFAQAGALATTGDLSGAAEELRALVDARPSWATVIRSFAEKGLLPLPPGISIEPCCRAGPDQEGDRPSATARLVKSANSRACVRCTVCPASRNTTTSASSNSESRSADW